MRNLPSTKPEAPKPLEIHVACKVIATRAQRAQRRREPRFQLYESSDRRRGAFAHRDSDPLDHLVLPKAGNAEHTQGDAIRAFSLFASLDKASELDVPGGTKQH